MKKSLSQQQYNHLHALYLKLASRLNKHFASGRFSSFSMTQKAKLIERIERIKIQLQRLEIGFKMAGVALTFGIAVCSNTAEAQTGAEFRVNTYTTSNQSASKIAMDSDGDFVVVWESYGQDSPSYGIYAQRYNATGTAQGAEFQVNTYTTNHQRNPSVAIDSDGDFVVAWYSYNQDGSNNGIYAQRYNAAGVAQGAEFKINTFTTGDQKNPSVAMDSDGDFVVAWESFAQDESGYYFSSFGVYAQRYNAAGVAQGAEFRVNTRTTSHQLNPSVASDSDGDFVVTWQSKNQDGLGYGIFAQRYNALGVVQGSEFRVNTTSLYNQINPATAMDSDGDFVVVWGSNHNNSLDFDIYAQRYDVMGVAQGSEFQVNTYTTSIQHNPSVAMDSDGDFVATWQSFDQDGLGYGIYAQRYNASGIAQGSEFIVNTYTTNGQSYPSTTIDSHGDFVVAWQSADQDGLGEGIYAQRYYNNPPVIAPQSFSIAENSATTSAVGTVVASDADASQTLSYAITAGNTGSVFAINSSTGAITVAGVLDYEATNSYSLTIEVTDNGEWTKKSSATITIDITDVVETGILQDKTLYTQSLYPNPAKDQVQLSLEGKATVTIMDMSGQVIKEVILENKKFEVEGLKPGVYLIEIAQEFGSMAQKLIIE